MEGNFISGLIDYCKYKKNREEKILKLKQKNKFVFKKPKLNNYDFRVKTNKNKRKTINYLCIGNKHAEEEKKANNENLNDSKTSNLDNQFKFCSIIGVIGFEFFSSEENIFIFSISIKLIPSKINKSLIFVDIISNIFKF